jgi:hypothetical protein
MFYIGYMAAQAPWAYLIGRFPAGRVLGVSTLIWGASVLTMVVNKNYTHILVNRFFLGYVGHQGAATGARANRVCLVQRLRGIGHPWPLPHDRFLVYSSRGPSPSDDLVLCRRLWWNDRLAHGRRHLSVRYEFTRGGFMRRPSSSA